MCSNNNCRGCPEHKTDRIPVANDPLILPYQVINGREMPWYVVKEVVGSMPEQSHCVFVIPTHTGHSAYPKLKEWLTLKHISPLPCVIKF